MGRMGYGPDGFARKANLKEACESFARRTGPVAWAVVQMAAHTLFATAGIAQEVATRTDGGGDGCKSWESHCGCAGKGRLV